MGEALRELRQLRGDLSNGGLGRQAGGGEIGTSPAAGQAGRTAATTGTVSDTRKRGKQMFRF